MGEATALRFTGDVDIIDGHAHPCLDLEVVTGGDVLAAFSEADDAAYVAEHAAHTVTARAGVRYIAGLLGVGPSAREIARARTRLGLPEYTRRLLEPHRLCGVLVDTGYPLAGLSLSEFQETLATPCRQVLRVERLAETLFETASSPGDLIDQLGQKLASVDRTRVVAFKTIASYRGGLELSRPSAQSFQAAFDNELRAHETGRRIRLSEPAMIAAIVFAALEVANSLAMPVQVHTGFGDRDSFLPASNPWLLKPIFDAGEFARVPVILLHASYPYTREAGILAGLYSRVYTDISLASPLAGHGTGKIVLELLEQAPIGKILYGSDASCGPELMTWGAEVGKRAVDAALQTLVADEWLTSDEAAEWAARLFAENARSLYRLGGTM